MTRGNRKKMEQGVTEDEDGGEVAFMCPIRVTCLHHCMRMRLCMMYLCMSCVCTDVWQDNFGTRENDSIYGVHCSPDMAYFLR